MEIFERKSISDIVVKWSKYIGNKILEDCYNTGKKASTQTFHFFKENTINVNIEGFLKNEETLKVNYIMYFVETQGAYEELVNGLGNKANSEADTDTNSIRIVSGFIGGNVSNDFYETIFHELEHLYQYSVGMKKRRHLYNKVKELIERGYKDIDGYYVGVCCYYTFKHEQDAFAHQFYAWLHQNNVRGSFENVIGAFSPYKTMLNATDVLINFQKEEKMKEAIKYLGYTNNSFIKLVKYRRKRFQTKMLNVYKRYMEETATINEHNINEQIKRMTRILNEDTKKGYNIKWGLESIYIF